MHKYILQRIRLRKVIGTYKLDINKTFIFGRNEKADIIVKDESVSRKQSKIVVSSNGSVSLEDLDSANGTFLEQQKLSPNTLVILNSNQEIKFGHCEDIFKLVENPDFQQKIQNRSRSRSKSLEKKPIKLFQKQETKQQPWNQLNINTEDKIRFMKLMGVKNIDEVSQVKNQEDHLKSQEIQANLEKQFYSGRRDNLKRGLGL